MDAPDRLDLVRALLRARSTLLADLEPDTAAGTGRLLLRGDQTGTMQLYELSGDARIALTALPDPVADAHYVPGRRQAVVAVDEHGNERHQLYLIDLDAAAEAIVDRRDRLHALTDDSRYGHHFAGVTRDGRLLAYLSNRENGVDFDLWLCELASGEHRRLYAPGAWLQPAGGFSPDGRLISVVRPGQRPLDEDLVLVDVDTGEARIVLEHPAEASLVGAPAWTSATSFYVPSNVGRDFSTIVGCDLQSGVTGPLAGVGEDYDCEVVTSPDGCTALVIENRGGVSSMWLHDARSGAPGESVPTPEPGVVSYYGIPSPILSADGARIYYTLSTPRLPGDVYAYDRTSGETQRLTGPDGLESLELVGAETAQTESFDGEQISMLVFRPRSAEPRPPAVVMVHGGPEAQAVPAFNPVIQGLVLAGYGVVVPNVRGSTGYGKRFASLDDTTRRLDSVRDLAAVNEFLESAGFDRRRAALWGGSYGGYMVLAGVAFQPDLWAAGVDIVGISDLVTFLQNTADYRRAQREVEYGSLQHDREFLARASPLSHVDDIRTPLFVIHGRNDPRVPVGEAEQLAANLKRRGVPCTLRIYEDEGHGLARLANRLDAYPEAIAFLDRVLAPE